MHIKNPSSRVRAALGAVAALGVLALAACSSDTPAETTSSSAAEPAASDSAMTETMEVTDVTVGLIPILDVGPIYLGVEKGFFEEEGLNLSLELAQGGAFIIPSVSQGDYEFGFSNVTSLILATANGVGLEAVGPGASTNGTEEDMAAVLTTSDSGISTAKDLEGKKVGVNALANVNTATINQMVRDDGGDPTKVTYVELPFPDIVPAIVSGDIDAGQVVEPFRTAGVNQDLVSIGSNFLAMSPTFMIAEYFTSSDYAAENPDVVAAFEAALAKSFEYATANPDEVRAIVLDYTQMDEETANAVRLPGWPSEIDAASVDLQAELAVTDGTLAEIPDLSNLK
ncbi:ABC transporter substrate-binding protein [Demequina mangrovi]|uniref:NitT/TauT family transport system substrate-binding protein n=1 Tax=Demequina mangrovi TaxID=1043493 RepID=A0A1H6Y980_9MICO|nr:ABC transporter substrate-binding protein [Demequina mangrovi]SEJ37791.1 NitT/TauT family transport system substrate-binding protein [Demequina mangrovi]